MKNSSIVAIVPAAGVGSRMNADRPKQYLMLNGQTILEHTVKKLLQIDWIEHVVVSVSVDDPYFDALSIASDDRVIRVAGGQERSESVMNGLVYALQHHLGEWALVHDAARPCFEFDDVQSLVEQGVKHPVGAILASPVIDTIKKADSLNTIEETVDRNQLWRALTPQFFKTSSLISALEEAKQCGITITDEASALEFTGQSPQIVVGKSSNIKITQPEDLALAEFYLSQMRK